MFVILEDVERKDLASWMRVNPSTVREVISDISVLEMADALESVGGLGALIQKALAAQYEYELEDVWSYDLADDIDEAELDRRDRARDVALTVREGW